MNPSTMLVLDEMRRLFAEHNTWLDRRFADPAASVAPTPASSATASVATAAAPFTAACISPAPAPSAAACVAPANCAWSEAESHDSLCVAADGNGSVRLYNTDVEPEPEHEAAASVERSAQVPLVTAAMVERGEPYGRRPVSSYSSCAAWSVGSLTRHRPASPFPICSPVNRYGVTPISIRFPGGGALDVRCPSRSHSPSFVTQTFVADLDLSVTLVESPSLRTHLAHGCSYTTVTTQHTRPPTPTLSPLGDESSMVSAVDWGMPAVLTLGASKVLDQMWSHLLHTTATVLVVSEAEDEVPSTLPNRPWPPPVDHWLVNCEAELRPLPWPSFDMVKRFVVTSLSVRLWKPPWKLNFIHHGSCSDRGVSSVHMLVHHSIAYQPWRSDQLVICWISGATKIYLDIWLELVQFAVLAMLMLLILGNLMMTSLSN